MATQYTAQDFTDLLKIPKGYKQFKKYVQTGKATQNEISTEHEGALELDFWYEIECFKKDSSLSFALALFSSYMTKIATISEAHKTDIQSKLDAKQVDAMMFDNVQRDIFGIMRIQLFRDYAKTPEWLEFKQEVVEMREAALAALAAEQEEQNNNNNNGSTSPNMNSNGADKDKDKEKDKDKKQKAKVKKIKDPTDKPRKMCLKLLKDKNGFELFKNFLDNIYASESIEFWSAVEVFRKVGLENPAKLHGRAMAIYEQYLAAGSSKEINVDSETRQAVFKKLKLSLFDNEVFDPLQESVFHLLSSDCFHKFSNTPEYKQWKKSQQKKTVFGFSIPDVPIPVPQPVVRALSPLRGSSSSEKDKEAKGGDNIVYVDRQVCVQMMQDVQGCMAFRAFLEKECPSFVSKFDCWAEMELYRITVVDNPFGCHTLARNIYYKYIESGAELDVELNVHLRGYLQEKILSASFDATLFIHAQSELIDVIKEPFMKFTQTEEYKDYKATVGSKKKKSQSLREKGSRKGISHASHAGFNMYIDVLTRKELGIK